MWIMDQRRLNSKPYQRSIERECGVCARKSVRTRKKGFFFLLGNATFIMYSKDKDIFSG